MITELLCPECGDTWLETGEIIEDVESVERFCFYCDYFGLPEKNIITKAEIQVFYRLVDRLLKKLREEKVG